MTLHPAHMPTTQFNSPRPLQRIRHRMANSPIRIPVMWLRHRGLRDSDVFLGSYPRSGSTWLRFTLREILTGEPSDFQNVNLTLCGPGSHTYAPALLPEGGRFLSTHESYRVEYKKAVYLVRDVRDIVNSEFWYEKERGFGMPHFDDYLQRMLQGRRKLGSWHQHVHSWIDSAVAHTGNLLLLRYEDMRSDPEQAFVKLLQFLNMPVDLPRLRCAIENNSIAKMRAKEDQLHTAPPVPFRERPHVYSAEEGRFVRTGTVGGWRDKLTNEQVRLIEHYAGAILFRLGYALTSVDSRLPDLTAKHSAD